MVGLLIAGLFLLFLYIGESRLNLTFYYVFMKRVPIINKNTNQTTDKHSSFSLIFLMSRTSLANAIQSNLKRVLHPALADPP